MEFLKPYVLWGLLAMAIPVVIHLWNGRKGRTISWAATRFLEENDNVPVRHIQLKDYFLLFLRMLLLALVILLFAQLFLSILEKTGKGTVYHFVQPSDNLLSEFKFELQNAIDNSEPIYWLDSTLNPIEQIETQHYGQAKAAKGLAKAFELADDPSDEIHLYLINSAGTFESNFYTTHQNPNIHLSKNLRFSNDYNSIHLINNNILYVNDLNVIESAKLDQETNFDSLIKIENFGYYIDTKDSLNRQYIIAGLEAIEAVYEMPFVERNDQQAAELIFLDKLPESISSENSYWLINSLTPIEYPNVQLLNLPSYGEAASLPETILADLLRHYGVNRNSQRFTLNQIESMFITSDNHHKSVAANTSEIIWILFLLTLIAERIIANNKQL